MRRSSRQRKRPASDPAEAPAPTPAPTPAPAGSATRGRVEEETTEGERSATRRRVEELKRCDWLPAKRCPVYEAYHDDEWGVPQHDERTLFEMLCLEGQQAGLSWRTVLLKREGYREAFANFDAQRVARFTAADQARLVTNPAIIRHKGKIAAIVANAQAYEGVRQEFGGLGPMLWGMVRETPPPVERFTTYKQMPTQTDLSLRMSKALKQRGFKFVGPVAMLAFMQAVGMVQHHQTGCFLHRPAGPAGSG